MDCCSFLGHKLVLLLANNFELFFEVTFNVLLFQLISGIDSENVKDLFVIENHDFWLFGEPEGSFNKSAFHLLDNFNLYFQIIGN